MPSELPYQNPTEVETTNQNAAHTQTTAPAVEKPVSNQSSYAIGYQEALSLKLSARHAKFFADAFASEYDTALTNQLKADQAIAYATDFAGPYALAFMAFLKENSDSLTPSQLLPQAQNYAMSHIASYEQKFKDIQYVVLDTQAKEEQEAEKKRLEQQTAQEKLIKEQKEISRGEGYTQGFSDGKKLGATEHYDKGHKVGHKEGYEKGSDTGFKDAISKDYDEGLQLGRIEAYKKSGLAMTSFGVIGTISYNLYHYFF